VLDAPPGEAVGILAALVQKAPLSRFAQGGELVAEDAVWNRKLARSLLFRNQFREDHAVNRSCTFRLLVRTAPSVLSIERGNSSARTQNENKEYN